MEMEMKMALRGALLAWNVWTMPAAAEPSIAAKLDMLSVWMDAQSQAHAARNVVPTDDYPYIRAWAVFASWTKATLDNALALARRAQAPPDAVYADVKSYHGWCLINDLPPSMRRSIVKLATARAIR